MTSDKSLLRIHTGGENEITGQKKKTKTKKQKQKNPYFFFKHFQIHLQLKIYSHFIDGITVKLLQRSTRLINSKPAAHDSPVPTEEAHFPVNNPNETQQDSVIHSVFLPGGTSFQQKKKHFYVTVHEDVRKNQNIRRQKVWECRQSAADMSGTKTDPVGQKVEKSRFFKRWKCALSILFQHRDHQLLYDYIIYII